MDTSFNDRSSVLLVVDASQSAAPHWKTTVTTVGRLLHALPEGVVEQVHILGSRETLEPDYFGEPDPPRPEQAASLLAPVVAGLRHARRHVHAGILAGAGEVFDLADHQGSPWVGAWALLRVGEASLRPAGVELSEFGPSELPALLTWLNTISPPARVPSRRPLSAWSQGEQRWAVDRAGFPLVWVEPLQAWWQLFPVVKAQFETFLAGHPAFGDAWYSELLALNPRLSFRSADFSTYERLLLTGILPGEAAAFARWLGAGYTLPLAADWRVAYTWLAAQPPAFPSPELDRAGLCDAARQIWEGLFEHLQPASLLGLSLMDQGVIEWLGESGAPAGLGRTRPAFRPMLFNPLEDEPIRPIQRGSRLKHFGFRLCRRNT